MEIWKVNKKTQSLWHSFQGGGETKVEFAIITSDYILITHGEATQLYNMEGGKNYIIRVWQEINKYFSIFFKLIFVMNFFFRLSCTQISIHICYFA